MTALLVAMLAMLTVGAAGYALVPSAFGSNRAKKRMQQFQGDLRANRIEANTTRTREERRRNVQQALKQQSDALNRKKRLTLGQLIFQAGLATQPRTFIRNSVIFGAVAFLVLILVQVPWLFAAVFAVAAAYVLPRMYLNFRRRRYQDQFLDELPNAVEAIVRGVKTGLPLNDTVRLVARDAKEPVKSEFARVIDQQAFGLSMTEAVQVLLERVPLPEVNFFVVVISVQQQAGGNLSEALGNLARVLRNRKKMKLKVKAMSSEAKASAGIIGSLPFVVATLVSIMSPTYLQPLFTTPVGLVCLGASALMLAMGVFVMVRMVKFDF